MTDPTDTNNETDDKTQEQCSTDEENGRNPYQTRYGKSTWMPSIRPHVFTTGTMDAEELLESIPEERLDDIIYVEPSDDPECGAYNALTPIEKRVHKEIDAEPLEDDNERDGIHTLRNGERISDERLRGPTSGNIDEMLSEARRKAWFMGKAATGKQLPPMHGGVTINPTDTLTAFEMLGNIDREARKYRHERIEEEFGSVPKYMQSVIDDLEELARTAPHTPPHTFSPSRPAPPFYPIKHMSTFGSAIDRKRTENMVDDAMSDTEDDE